MDPTERTARIAGLLYLVIIVCGGFSEGVVRSTLVVPGDAAATAANITASQMLLRIGFASDLVAFMSDLAVSILFYVLLRPVNRTAALVAAAFRLVAHPAIVSVSLLTHIFALMLLGGGESLSAFDPAQLQALALLAMEGHGYGYLVGGAFFGVHLLLLGWLLARWERFPSILGVLVAIAGAGYLIDSFGMFLFPAFEGLYDAVVVSSAVAGEVSLCLYLLVKGVRNPADASTARPAAGGEA